jgi:putative transposon-encoded protein
MKRKVSEKPMDIQMQGYEVIEKVVTQHATSAKVLVPRHWMGKKVRAVRLEPMDEDEEKEG